MARLRRLGQIAEMLLRSHLSDQSRRDEQDRSFQQQDMTRRTGLTDKLSEQAISDPTKYDALEELAKGLKVPLRAPRPSNLQATAGMRADIDKEQNPEALPGAGELAQTLQSKFPKRPEMFTPQGGMVANPGEDGNLDSTNIQPTQTPTINDLMAKVAKQKEDIKAHLAGLASQAGAMKKAEAKGTGLGTEEANVASAPAVLGRKTAEFAAMTPLEASRSGAVKTATEQANLAPDLVSKRVNEASRTAGGQENARLGAENSPTNIAGAASRAGAITGAQEAAKGPDMASSTATGHWIRADQADKNATKLENMPGALNYTTAHYGETIPGGEMMLGPAAKQYNQAVKDFTLAALKTDVGRINREEYRIYAETYFGQPGDDQQTILAKQAARRGVIESLRNEGAKGMKQAGKLGLPIPLRVQPGAALNKLLEQ